MRLHPGRPPGRRADRRAAIRRPYLSRVRANAGTRVPGLRPPARLRLGRETMREDWDQQQAVFAETLFVLPRLIETVEPERLHRAPAPGEWSAHVVMCHLLLDEMNTAMILRLILTQDYPSLVAIDADNTLCEIGRAHV